MLHKQSVTEQQPNSLAAHWAVWLTVGNTQLNRWPYLVAKHSGHPGSWHQLRPVSPTWNPSWRMRKRTCMIPQAVKVERFLFMAGRWHTLKEFESYLKMVLVLAKLRTGPRTTSIPLSSDAFSWKIKLVRQQIKALVFISELLEMSTAGYEAEAFTSHETISFEVVAYFQHHGVELFVLVQLPGTSKDGGGFACSWGAIE